MGNRPTSLYIHRDNLKYNYLELTKLIAPGTTTMAVVKANAYGHGDIEITSALEELGCETFGVAMVEEGLRLRQGGIKGRIVILGGTYAGQAADCFEHALTPVVYDLAMARELDSLATERKTTIKIHVKIDTGMGRIGCRADEIKGFFTSLKELNNIEVEGLLSHMSEAENADKSFSRLQLDSFKEGLTLVKTLGFEPTLTHISNSASVVDFPQSHLDMVRPGLMLYGVYPAERFKTLIDLKPVMEFKTEITQLKRVPAGQPISYGRTFTTKRDSLIATVPAGYADGVPRRLSGLSALSSQGEMLVRGQRAPITGVVCMDMTMLDVTEIENANLGDEVLIIGSQGTEEITALDIAEKVGTIPYEILTNIGARVPRVYT